jgi:elongation factor G
MKIYPSKSLRNVALIGHAGAGKTSLADAMVFTAGGTNRLGKVSDGTSLFDTEPEEIARKNSLTSAVGCAEWRDHRVTIMDTPGLPDFFGAVFGPVHVADAVVVVVSAVDGVEVQTERAWALARERPRPAIVFVNKLDAERAEFDQVVQQVRERLNVTPAVMQRPIGLSANFKGVVDVLRGKAYTWAAGATGKGQESDIPADLQSEVDAARESLTEAAAEGNDELLEKYLDSGELSADEVRVGLRQAIWAGKVAPVLCGVADKTAGVANLLDAIIDFLPSPLDIAPVPAKKPRTGETISVAPAEGGPLAAQVFKTVADIHVGRLSFVRVFAGELRSDSTVYNSSDGQRERIGQLFIPQGKERTPIASAKVGEIVATAKLEHTNTGHTLCDEANAVVFHAPQFPRPTMWLAIHAKSRGDEDKLSLGLRRLIEEDGSLQWYRNNDTNETILAGMGDQHLQMAIERLKRLGVEVTTTIPKVPYRETIRKKVTYVEGRHKKQTGGAGQFGVAFIDVEPLPRGGGFEFIDAIVGGVIPNTYIPSVEKGVRERLEQGFLAGYPMVDVRVKLVDGKTHPVDSNAISFQLAGRLAIEAAVPQCHPYLLEPIYNVEVTVPEENMGDVLGDLNSRRGRPMGMETNGGWSVVKAQVPLAEMLTYSATLRSLTRGRGTFAMELSHYEEVPAHIAGKVIEEAKKKD